MLPTEPLFNKDTTFYQHDCWGNDHHFHGIDGVPIAFNGVKCGEACPVLHFVEPEIDD